MFTAGCSSSGHLLLSFKCYKALSDFIVDIMASDTEVYYLFHVIYRTENRNSTKLLNFRRQSAQECTGQYLPKK